MADPKIIFCDIGGVLLSNGWGHASRQDAAKKFSINYEEMDYLHDFIFNTYEIGSITLDEYLDVVVFNKTRNFTRDSFKDFMFDQSVELPGMLAWLKEWKQQNSHVRIIAVNNEGRELNNFRVKKFKLHECFDAFVSSCEVGMRKPDPGIFRLALGVAHAEAGDCLYFDDRAILAEAARKIGINAYTHESFEKTRAIIEGN